MLAVQHPDRPRAGAPIAVSSIRHNYENHSDIETLWQAIGKLVDIRWEGVDVGGRRRRVSLPTYPFERQTHWLESLHVPEAARQQKGLLQKNANLLRSGYMCRPGNGSYPGPLAPTRPLDIWIKPEHGLSLKTTRVSPRF